MEGRRLVDKRLKVPHLCKCSMLLPAVRGRRGVDPPFSEGNLRRTMSEQQAQRFVQQAGYALQQVELQQALGFVDQAIALSPDNADAHLVRGVALSKLGQAAEATAALNRAIQLRPHEAKGYYNLALHYQGLGYTAEAVEMANEALKCDR